MNVGPLTRWCGSVRSNEMGNTMDQYMCSGTLTTVLDFAIVAPIDMKTQLQQSGLAA